MAGVPGDEDAVLTVFVCLGNSQIPEANVLEFDIDACPDCTFDKTAEIEIVFGCVSGNRRMKKPRCAKVDPAEESPVTLQFFMEHAVKLLIREPVELLVQLL